MVLLYRQQSFGELSQSNATMKAFGKAEVKQHKHFSTFTFNLHLQTGRLDNIQIVNASTCKMQTCRNQDTKYCQILKKKKTQPNASAATHFKDYNILCFWKVCDHHTCKCNQNVPKVNQRFCWCSHFSEVLTQFHYWVTDVINLAQRLTIHISYLDSKLATTVHKRLPVQVFPLQEFFGGSHQKTVLSPANVHMSTISANRHQSQCSSLP